MHTSLRVPPLEVASSTSTPAGNRCPLPNTISFAASLSSCVKPKEITTAVAAGLSDDAAAAAAASTAALLVLFVAAADAAAVPCLLLVIRDVSPHGRNPATSANDRRTSCTKNTDGFLITPVEAEGQRPSTKVVAFG